MLKWISKAIINRDIALDPFDDELLPVEEPETVSSALPIIIIVAVAVAVVVAILLIRRARNKNGRK